MLRIGDEHVSLRLKNVAGARSVFDYTTNDPRRRCSIVSLTTVLCAWALGGLKLAQIGRFVGTGLRVRPPPSLLRGLQAPSDSLSPSDGAVLF